MEEIWKETEYPGYFISNLGRLKGRTNKILKLRISKPGYYIMVIYPNGRHDKCKCLKIHRLVAQAFIPNPNGYPVINHIDGNKLNNNAKNLEWCTYSYNTKHAYDNGLINAESISGCNNSNSKLSEEDVKWIREHYKPFDKEFGATALGKKFNMNNCNISRLARGLRYK
nr:MAG TPA: homing endonuclease [Caudoviricetes sp.]